MKRIVIVSLAIAVLTLAASFLIILSRTPARSTTPAPRRDASGFNARPGTDPPAPVVTSTSAPVPNAGRTAMADAGPPAPFVAFADWAGAYLSGRRASTGMQGEALAWKRREAMTGLIRSDPARALSLAAPFRWHHDLPPEVSRHLERWVDGRGSLEVAIADSAGTRVFRRALIGGQKFEVLTANPQLGRCSRNHIPLHGIVIDRQMALLPDPLRVLEIEEAESRGLRGLQGSKCQVCGRRIDGSRSGIVADLGGEIAVFCSNEHLAMVNAKWVAAALTAGSAPATDLAAGGGETWTQGRKSLLYMRVNFSDDLTEPVSAAGAYQVLNSVNTFYVQNSYDTTWLTATVTPLLTMPQVKEWYSTDGPFALLDDAREAARQAGFDTANYDLDIVSHTQIPDFAWSGLGFVGGKGTWLQSYGAGVTGHELGHNYGLLHANFWNTSSNYLSAIGQGTNVEYGNIFDTMGAANGGPYQFSAYFKNQLAWLPGACVHDVTSNGVYRLYAFDVPQRVNGRSYAARVRKDFQRDYWLEFRQAFPGNASLGSGVLLNWSAWSQSGGGSDLLDTIPETSDLRDAAVVVGRTFSDRVAGVHLTPVARSADPPNPWIDVQVNLGPFPDNWAPVTSIEIDRTNAAPGELIHFHADASDLEGDPLAYAWSFDDGTFSTNNSSWVSKSWSVPGEHVVRCVVSDMKGGIASANALVTIGQPAGFHISGVVLDESGDPMEDVILFTDATNSLTCRTDSDGYYIVPGLGGDVSVQATQYGYTFTNLTWQNPLSITSNVARIDFVGLAFTNVSLAISTNRITEGSATPGVLTLTRNSTNEELTVNLFVSGTAVVPGDVSFSPPLTEGANLIVIPAGASNAQFTFTAVGNNTVEDTEILNVTLIDDTNRNYVIAPPAEVRLTILDDDLPVLPLVTIAAANHLVPENGVDDAVFVFSRTGPTGADLPVFYSAGGTATAGIDYPTPLGIVVIPAGQRSASVEFAPVDDKDVEPDETITLTINANPTYQGGGSSAVATIADDDLLVVTVTPTGGGASESGVSGRFTIKRDGDQTGNLVVYYTLSGTAGNGVDYVSPPGAVTIAAGQTSADIPITPIDDALTEGDESVVLTVTQNPAYDIGTPGEATLFIQDNEKVSVSITAPDNHASEPGNDLGTFVVSRGGVVNGNLAVYLALSGTATPGADYVPLDNPVVIPDGAGSVTLDLIPFDDLHIESPESVILTLMAGTNYNIGASGQASVIIDDDDPLSIPAVGFTFGTSRAPEDRSPGISVSLSETSSAPVTVNYLVLGGTASNDDYSLPRGPLTFNPGERAKSIPLAINDDALVEPDETIRVALFEPTNATHDAIRIHTYTIVDNDLSSVSVSATANASESGPVPGNFRITRTGNTNVSLTVNFQVTGTASAPGDYAFLGTSIILPAGVTSLDVPVNPVADTVVELDETVVLTLISAPGASIVAPATATVWLADDDSDNLPRVSVSSASQPTALEGGGNGEFVFTRTGSTTGALTVYFTIGGTAGNGIDFNTITNVLTIPAGQLSLPVLVSAIDDTAIEGDETVVAALTVRDTYRVSFPASATVVIQDNDQRVQLDASDFVAAEPGTDRGAFTFTRFGTTNAAVRVFFTINGTAINGVDYAAITNSFVIPAGSLSATLPIQPLNDPLVEGDETVILGLEGNPAYTLSTPRVATVTIVDDEPMVSILAHPAAILEGGPEPGVFTVLRGGDPSYEFTVPLAVGGTAAYGVDYPPFLTNVFFSCGVTSIDLLVFPTNELAVENLETVTAALVPSPIYTIRPPSNALLSIEDAGTNRAPFVIITSPTAPVVFLLRSNVNIILESSISDDGDTNTPITISWTNIAGSGMTFTNTDQANTTASFTNGGLYVLRVTVDDCQLTNFDEVTVFVDTTSVLDSNLLHWTFDDGSGTTVSDASGNGRAGIVVGPAVWVTNGAFGGALRLNGTNNFVREAIDSGLLNGRKQFSLSLWVKADHTNSDRGIFAGTDIALPTLSLVARNSASCGSASNVVEAALTTTRGEGRHVSASNVNTTDWQQLALTWSNGLAPSLFINGQPDQKGRQMAPVRGLLTNCFQFLVGKGPTPTLNTWDGLVDEVRLFPRALDPVEVQGIAATNYGPIVEVPTNLIVQVLTPVTIAGTVTDDGRPVPPGFVSNTWSQIGGPLSVSISDPHSLTNSIEFIQAGDYVFRLIADDGEVKVFQDLPVTVVEPTTVYVFPSDGAAAELGPDPGEFTFWRSGDLGFALPIQLSISGTASNGADFTLITQTNSLTFGIGTDTVIVPIVPFLDHRTEGDETVIYTIVSNLAYTIGSGEATVTIRDSPYGMWNIDHFTLEELTDPTLSGEGADFDHDGRVNFVEYAFNLDPKAPETNSPLRTAIELNPGDGQSHITLTYQRWIEPRDVEYEVRTSNDLVNWNAGPAYIEEVEVADDGNNLTETVKARLVAPWPTGTCQFVTIRVWLRSTGP